MYEEEEASTPFRSKIIMVLILDELAFSGMMLQIEPDRRIPACQENNIRRLTHPTYLTSFTITRALAQFIGVFTRPDLRAGVQLLAPSTEATTPASMDKMTKSVNSIKETEPIGLNFNPRI